MSRGCLDRGSDSLADVLAVVPDEMIEERRRLGLDRRTPLGVEEV